MIYLKRIFLATGFLFLLSCSSSSKKEAREREIRGSLNILMTKNTRWIADNLFNGDDKIIKSYIRKYHADTCGAIGYEDTLWSRFKERITPKTIGDINGDGKEEEVMVFPSFSYCDDGWSYYFSDTTFPRLFPETYALETGYLFLSEDMDEDGIKEIGTYQTSGVSNYKCIRVFKLKNNQWEEIGHSVFHILTQDPERVSFDTLVKKISKNEFKMCNFMDGRTYWETTDISSANIKESK